MYKQTVGLPKGVVDLNAQWIVQIADESGHLGSLSLLGSVNVSVLLVCPVDVILKHSDTVDEGDSLTQNYR